VLRICAFAIGVLVLTTNTLGETAGVVLQAHILSERYCEVDENFGSFLVKFGVRISNEGEYSIKINPPFYPLLLVARSVEDLRKGKLEFKLYPPDDFTPRSEQSSSPPHYVILTPGKTHESETAEISASTLRTSNYNKHAGLSPGIHYVQVVIFGEVEDGSVTVKATSQPIEIKIEKDAYILKCN